VSSSALLPLLSLLFLVPSSDFIRAIAGTMEGRSAGLIGDVHASTKVPRINPASLSALPAVADDQ
jgi:hypothetical protein